MRTRLKILAIASVCAVLWASGVVAESKLPVPHVEIMPNGLKIVWFLSDSLPVVDLALMVRSGYRDDPPGKSGTAELLSASLERGAGQLTSQQLARAIDELGASRFVSADDDTFSVGLHGLAPDASKLLELLSKITLQPEFAETEVAREQARILDRWTHVPDYGEALVGLAFRRALTSGTSYGRGSLSSAKEFARVKQADVVAFHRTHFTPKNAVLMVVGRVPREEFRAQILKRFGSPEVWKGELPPETRKVSYVDPRLPKRQAGAILLLDRPLLTQAQVRIGFQAPSIHAPDHYALVVANALLGEYFNSRLNALIRDKLGLTYGIGSATSYSQDQAVLTISAATRNESVGPLIEKTLGVLKELKRGPIPREEVETARQYLVGGFPLGTSTLGAVAARWLGGEIFGLGNDYLNEFIPKVSAVTAEQVATAVAKGFDLDHLTIAVAGDAQAISKSLSAAHLMPVVRVDISQLL